MTVQAVRFLPSATVMFRSNNGFLLNKFVSAYRAEAGCLEDKPPLNPPRKAGGGQNHYGKSVLAPSRGGCLEDKPPLNPPCLAGGGWNPDYA